MIESAYRRFSHLGVKGLTGILLAVAVTFFTVIARAMLFFIPQTIISKLDFERAKHFFKGFRLFRGFHDDAEPVTLDMSAPQLIKHFGYPVEEHTVYTDDGYVLTYHRIPHGKKEPTSTIERPPVFIMHGLMQCSEAWVCNPDSLAFTLADEGFDVWLGNNRGNKYGFKHVAHKPTQSKFWDFSLDEFARYDVPGGINYILKKTGMSTLTYIGFSQGSAQAFACFSTMHHVAAKVNLFIALSPAAKANGLTRGLLSTFIRMAPQALFLLFGVKSLWSSVFVWRTLLSRRTFTRCIDMSCKSLFAWHMTNIGDMSRKLPMYSHLYSYTSVKTVVHWFQIVAQDRFQQYDDNDVMVRNKYEDIAPHVYPISQIECDVAVIYGSADYLPDMKWILESIPKHSKVIALDDYEHLDTMWAQDAPERVFPTVVGLARMAAKPQHGKRSQILPGNMLLAPTANFH